MDYIKGNVHLLLLFFGALIGLGVLLRRIYAFRYFTLEGCGFKEARKVCEMAVEVKRLKERQYTDIVRRKILKKYHKIVIGSIIFAMIMLRFFCKNKLN